MDDLDQFLHDMLSNVDFARAYVSKLEANNQRLQAELDARFDRKVAEDILGTVQDLLNAGQRMHDTLRIQADTQRIQAELISVKDSEIEILRAAANRTLNAFFCCEGLDNTHLMDAFSEWAVLINPEAFPEAAAWIAKFKARHD